MEKKKKTFKCVMLGQSGVGKTSIVNRYIRNNFNLYGESTIGASFCVKEQNTTYGIVRLEIWDTAGQERYNGLTPLYYRGATVCMIVYSVVDMESFERAKKWIKTIKDIKDENRKKIIMLIGTKIDISPRVVSEEMVKKYIKEQSNDGSIYSNENDDTNFDENKSNKIMESKQFESKQLELESKQFESKQFEFEHCECSSLTGKGIENLFDRIYLKLENVEDYRKKPENIVLSKPVPKTSYCSC
jgi:small GTP-binding protein